MALRRWRGVLASENVQTGDGRVIALGALEWPEMPQPLGWLERQMHGDLLDGATQVGNIQEVAMVSGDLTGWGFVDDAIPEGAELIRRMVEGSAPQGHRVGLSIDPDNWAVELYDTTASAGDADDGASDDEYGALMLSASGSGPWAPLQRRWLRAAAGDPDAGADSGELLMTDEAGGWLERYTRLRVRGVTAVAIAAFISGYMELDEAAAEDGSNGSPPPAAEPNATVTAAALLRTTVAPPRFAFELPEPEPGMHDDGSLYGMPVQELLVEQPDGGLAVPVTFTERDYGWQLFGHAARFGQCHVGYLDECVTAPESLAAYAHFHVGEVACADGSRISTGALSVNTDHAAAHMLAPEARDHYANTGLAFADVRATNGALGVWVSGVVRPGITDEQLRVLRASSLSGDWRLVGANLEFIAALAVNVPGFPIAREYVSASALRLPRAALAASAHVESGRVMSLVASGVVQRCRDCARRQMSRRTADDVTSGPGLNAALDILRTIELRTRHLVPTAAEHALSSVRPKPLALDQKRVTNRPLSERVRAPRRRG